MSASRSDFLTFVAGLNTEGGYFTQPANTWREGDNLAVNIDGTVVKRKALDFESGMVFSTEDVPNVGLGAYTVGVWRTAGGVAGLIFYVVQIGGTLYFYGNTSSAISADAKSFTVQLNSYRVVGSSYVAGTVPVSCTSADGALIVTASDIDPLYITYDEDSDDIAITPLSIKIRDLSGVDDGLEIDEKPNYLTSEHYYNLLNQGWNSSKILTYAVAGLNLTPTAFSLNGYPSNSQMWIYGKDSSDNFSKTVLDKVDFGTSAAPRGRFIIDAFNQVRTVSDSDFVDPATVSETTRPSTCCFFAGRAWYAGCEGRFGSAVFFSRIGEKPEDFAQCYQLADPTSEVLSDLVETDGGVIYIKDADTIKHITPFADGILVFAENGVWQIIGSSQGGFTATGYSLYKVTSVGVTSSYSVVQVENVVFYWSDSGVYKVQQDPQSPGVLISVSLTDLNIKTFYQSIVASAKRYAVGTYNLDSKCVVWSYGEDEGFPYRKNKFLILDLRLGAFYTYSTTDDNNYPIVVSHVVVEPANRVDVTYTVVDNNGDTVVDSSDDTVISEGVSVTTKEVTEKYLTVALDGGVYKWTFSDLETTADAPAKWLDWYTYNTAGIEYAAYLVTGYDTGTVGPSNKKYPMYVTAYFKETEDGWTGGVPDNQSGCLMSTRWDFTNSAVSGKWSAEQQVYRKIRPLVAGMVSGHPLVITKNKVRGSGKAVQFRFEAESGKDMQMVGWQVLLMNNEVI